MEPEQSSNGYSEGWSDRRNRERFLARLVSRFLKLLIGNSSETRLEIELESGHRIYIGQFEYLIHHP